MAWFTTADNMRLRYTDQGFADQGSKRAQPLVLLHEIGMCIEAWDTLASLLAPDYRVLRLDLRSHGLSQTESGPPKMVELVGDVHALLNHCQIAEPVILCGGAVGGAVALSFAATYPKLTRAVVAASPAVGVPAEAKSQALAMADGIAAHGFGAVLGDAGLEGLYPRELRTDEALFQDFLNLSYIASNTTTANYLRMVANLDIQAQLESISVPVTLLGGRFDAMRPAAVVEALAATIPAATYQCIDSGHYVSLQAPHALAKVISAIN